MRLSEQIRSEREKTRGPRTERRLPSSRGQGEREPKTAERGEGTAGEESVRERERSLTSKVPKATGDVI